MTTHKLKHPGTNITTCIAASPGTKSLIAMATMDGILHYGRFGKYEDSFDFYSESVYSSDCILTTDITKDDIILYSGSEKITRALDVNTEKTLFQFQHTAQCFHVKYIQEMNLVFAATFDGKALLLDPRSKSDFFYRPTHSFTCNDILTQTDMGFPYVYLCSTLRMNLTHKQSDVIEIYDIRKFSGTAPKLLEKIPIPGSTKALRSNGRNNGFYCSYAHNENPVSLVNYESVHMDWSENGKESIVGWKYHSLKQFINKDPGKPVFCTAMSENPDHSMLALSHTNGSVQYVDIKDQCSLHELQDTSLSLTCATAGTFTKDGLYFLSAHTNFDTAEHSIVIDSIQDHTKVVDSNDDRLFTGNDVFPTWEKDHLKKPNNILYKMDSNKIIPQKTGFHFPDEILLEIVSFLSYNDLYPLIQVNSTFHDVIQGTNRLNLTEKPKFVLQLPLLESVSFSPNSYVSNIWPHVKHLEIIASPTEKVTVSKYTRLESLLIRNTSNLGFKNQSMYLEELQIIDCKFTCFSPTDTIQVQNLKKYNVSGTSTSQMNLIEESLLRLVRPTIEGNVVQELDVSHLPYEYMCHSAMGSPTPISAYVKLKKLSSRALCYLPSPTFSNSDRGPTVAALAFVQIASQLPTLEGWDHSMNDQLTEFMIEHENLTTVNLSGCLVLENIQINCPKLKTIILGNNHNRLDINKVKSTHQQAHIIIADDSEAIKIE